MIEFLDNEKIILTRRRHWFVILIEGISLALAALLPIIGLIVFGLFFPTIANFPFQYWLFALFGAAAWTQLVWMFFFIAWTNYYLDVILVTNKRVIDIEQIGLFSREIADLRLENIQDIKVEIAGWIYSFLKIGHLHIQSAGQSKEFLLRDLPEVQEVKNIILKCHDEVLKEKY